MVREICTAILPTPGLVHTLAHWTEIAQRLAESKRKHKRRQRLVK